MRAQEPDESGYAVNDGIRLDAVLEATGTDAAVLAGMCSGVRWAALFAAAHWRPRIRTRRGTRSMTSLGPTRAGRRRTGTRG